MGQWNDRRSYESVPALDMARQSFIPALDMERQSFTNKIKRGNQSPKGIMRSAVPLPCFFDVVKSQTVAGQRPQQGTKSCRMGRNSVRPSVHPSNHPFPIQGV